MTKLTLKEVRDRFDSRITVMGGVPSVSLLKTSMSDDIFEAYMDEFFTQVGCGDHLILGISDTTPPAADFERIKSIGARTRLFRPPTLSSP